MEKTLFKILIIYQNPETGNAALRTYDRLADGLKHDFELCGNVWHLDAFTNSNICQKASKQAKDANLIIFSHRKDCQLSSTFKQWFEAFLLKKDESSAFFSLCQEVVDTSKVSSTYSYFRGLVKKAPVTFFSKFWSSDEESSSHFGCIQN